ncbi:MAG: hypothetical protein KC503_38495 [Myxococcales bacterium]|nr:hypothetical protein [Myxococcales bacterium]
MGGIGGLIGLLGLAVGIFAVVHPRGIMRLFSSAGMMSAFKNKKIEGSFSSKNNKTVGSWTLAPKACVAGKERGFHGMAFSFAPEAPVDEVRLHMRGNGRDIVEVRMADEKGTRIRVHERHCKVVTGQVRRSNVTINGRHMYRLSGWVRYDCPRAHIKGKASFDGCLPVTLGGASARR